MTPNPAIVRTDGLEDLERELAWLTALIDLRFSTYFAAPGAPADPRTMADVPPPDLGASRSPWADFVRERVNDDAERLALVLAMVPHLRPVLLDVFFTRNATFDRRFTEFGGAVHGDVFEPTGETVAFVLGGTALAARLQVAALLDADDGLVRTGVLVPGGDGAAGHLLRAPLRVAPEYLAWFTTGVRSQPALSHDFPAQRIQSSLDWEDLILHPGTLKQIQEVQAFIVHGETLMGRWGMAARLRPGHRGLFHGPPGTGKTMSVGLLGKVTGREVYRVDLSLVVSKYIGETEKNLARVFERAEQRDWILFFDEADALFGQRTEARDAHDRYANQEVAYLLQRIETFSGIAILASNMRESLDDAFLRRFESVVYFPLPRMEERLRLWRRGFSPQARLAADVDLEEIARDHELSGGSIMNVIRHVSLMAIAEGEREIRRDDLVAGTRRERSKEGRA